jgi:hypothetical protein
MRSKRGVSLAVCILMLAWLILFPSASSAFSTQPNQRADSTAFTAWLPIVASPPMFFVDGNLGSDGNPGSLARPWKTIQKAADTLAPGQVVFVKGGDYSNQRVSITRSGTVNSWITFQAQGLVVTKGFKIVANYIRIAGFEIANTDYRRWDYETSSGIFIRGAHNILENNYIHDSSLEGIELYVPPGDTTATHDNIIRGNRIFRNELVGIDVNGRNNLIEANEIWRTVQCHPNLTRVEDAATDNKGKKCPNYPALTSLDADGIRFFGQGHIFRKNNIHDIIMGDTINGVNVNVNPHIDIFQTFAGATSELAQNILFEQNYCENLNSGMYIFMLQDGTNHLYIRNNIFKANGGINTGGGADYLFVYNNIWANDLSFGSNGQSGAISLRSVPHAEVKNNIFYDQVSYTVQVLNNTSNIEVDYNLAYNSDGSTPHCVSWGNYDTCQPAPNHELWKVNPKFVDPGSRDYHLGPTSPAIDAGYALWSLVPNDYEDVIRPVGAGFDIGPYEFVNQ